MTVSVIVVQSGSFGAAFDKAQKLKAAGFKEGKDKDFVAASHPEDVEWAFAKNERQLLIIGTDHGLEEPTARFVKQAKEKNPHLVVWVYSGMPSKHPQNYDRVTTGSDRPSIPELVRSYLTPSN